MSWRSKTALISAIIAANLAILWWRHEHRQPEIKGVGPFIAALGATQADTVVAWRNSTSVPLTRDAINSYVKSMKWEGCASLASSATALLREELSAPQQEALSRTVANLMETYSQSDPGRLYDFMTTNGQELSQSSIATLRRLLTTDGGIPEEELKNLGPRRLFVLMGQKIHYNSHWQALASDSGCVTLWYAQEPAQSVLEELPLGHSMASQFKNQTRYHHLFENKSKIRAVASSKVVFADVQFVVKHDQRLMSEPSTYHVRLRLEPSSVTWHPVEMVHVATISGNSPPLLF